MDSVPATPAKREFSFWRMVLLAAIAGTICVLTMNLVASRIVSEAENDAELATLRCIGIITPTPRGLDPKFTDADQNLVADPPADPSTGRSPETLVFSFVAGSTAEEELSDWGDFTAHLSRVTGKPVETAVFASTAEQFTALENGRLHVTGFNTGAVPTAVALYGFVPVCTFGNDDGSFGIQMQFIVPADGPIKQLQDVKGHKVLFTSPDSNSGCRAALALLQEYDLLPERDYSFGFSYGHDESIKRTAGHEYDVAPVASDLLQRAISTGAVKPEELRIIYESERFPPATLGYAYDLSDELAAKIRQAFLDFDCRGTSLERRFDDSSATRFVPLNYKQDYALVRQIDSAFRRPSRMASP